MTEGRPMDTLDRLAWEVLDATADDWENLQQIFFAVCCEVPDAIPQEQYGLVYAPKHVPRLREVADQVVRLVEAGLLEAREEDRDAPVSDLSDRSYVWRAWFAMTPKGRAVWGATAAAYAG
jgi:hypothetical protein